MLVLADAFPVCMVAFSPPPVIELLPVVALALALFVIVA